MKHIIIALALTIAAPAHAGIDWTIQERGLTFPFASDHPQNEGLNEINPGAGVYIKWGDDLRFGLSASCYYGSWESLNCAALADLDYRIIDGGEVDLYAGGFAGTVMYHELIELADENNIPHLGPWMPVAGLSIGLKFERVELVGRYTPFGQTAWGFSLRIPIGGKTR